MILVLWHMRYGSAHTNCAGTLLPRNGVSNSSAARNVNLGSQSSLQLAIDFQITVMYILKRPSWFGEMQSRQSVAQMTLLKFLLVWFVGDPRRSLPAQWFSTIPILRNYRTQISRISLLNLYISREQIRLGCGHMYYQYTIFSCPSVAKILMRKKKSQWLWLSPKCSVL